MSFVTFPLRWCKLASYGALVPLLTEYGYVARARLDGGVGSCIGGHLILVIAGGPNKLPIPQKLNLSELFAK